jgi:hypothetical protein
MVDKESADRKLIRFSFVGHIKNWAIIEQKVVM